MSTTATVSVSAKSEEGTYDSGCGQLPDWAGYAQFMKEYDKVMVKGWKEEIDNLLVFAGLFSAVVTAFNIEAYKFLEDDPSQTTVQLLQQISQQLAQGSNVTNVAPLLTARSTFQPPTQSIRLNVLWFCSLVCALFSALIGIMAKQWIREYTSATSVSPRETVRLRQHRYEGLVAWHVPEIMAVLPLLLEFSLILFLAGLIDFLFLLDSTVAIVVTVLITLALLFYVATAAIPIISTRCPFKSPQSWMLLKFMQKLTAWSYQLRRILGLVSYSVPPIAAAPHLSTWSGRDHLVVQGYQDDLDLKAITWIYVSVVDEQMRTSLISVIPELRPKQAALFVYGILAIKLDLETLTLINLVREHTCAETLQFHPGIHTDKKGRTQLICMLLELLRNVPRGHNPSPLSPLDVLWTVWTLFSGISMGDDPEPQVLQTVVNEVARLINESQPFRLRRAALTLLYNNTQAWVYLYSPVTLANIITFATSCHHHRILDMFLKATSIVLFLASDASSFSAWEDAPYATSPYHRQQLRELLRDLSTSLQRCNENKMPYEGNAGPGSVTKLVHGLAVLDERDEELIGVGLPGILLEGVDLGLLSLSEEERQMLQRMQERRQVRNGTRSAASSKRRR